MNIVRKIKEFLVTFKIDENNFLSLSMLMINLLFMNSNSLHLIINRISELNLIKSLQFIHDDISYFFGENEIPSGDLIMNEHIPPYFLDFLISNIIVHSDLNGKNSLFDSQTRFNICEPLNQIQNQANRKLIQEDYMSFLRTFRYNQEKMQRVSDPRVAFYRYYYIFNNPQVNKSFKEKNSISIESYFGWSIFCYVAYRYTNTFCYKVDSFIPPKLEKQDLTAINFVLGKICRSFDELKKLCRDHQTSKKSIFLFDELSPHVRYPLFSLNNKIYCVIPDYILRALLGGFYFIFDLPNNQAKNIVAERFEKYVGVLFEHFFANTEISYVKEISYSYKKQAKKTSDWIFWNSGEIAFLDCKLKRMSLDGKKNANIDNNVIESILIEKNFSRKYKHEVLEKLRHGLTKDIVDLGIDVGKILVSYDDYCNDRINSLRYMGPKKFYAFLLTVEESYMNLYKDKILKIAKAYFSYKTKKDDLNLDPGSIRIISAKTLEEDINLVRYNNKIDMLGKGIHTNSNLDNFLIKKFKKELIDPFMDKFKDVI